MRLIPIAKELPGDKLVSCLELAQRNDPTNNEVPYWLGVHLLQGDPDDPSEERWADICRGVDTLQLSTRLNPADARAHYHLGMAICTRHKHAMRTRRAHLLPPAEDAADSLIGALETAIRLERRCAAAGCDNELNVAAAFLALGDFVLRLGEFEKARAYLAQVEDSIEGAGAMDEPWAQDMRQQVSSMLEYCQRQLAEKEASLVK